MLHLFIIVLRFGTYSKSGTTGAENSNLLQLNVCKLRLLLPFGVFYPTTKPVSTATPTEKTACLFLFPPLGRTALLFLFCFASRRRGNAAEVWIEECQSMELSVSYL